MHRQARLICTTAIIALATAPLYAVELFWQGTGVTGTLTDANYSDGTNTNLSPTAADILDIGGGGTATYSVSGPISFEKLRVGHQSAVGGAGSGTVTISNGAQVSLTVGASGAANASLWVGNLENGTLNLDGSGTSLTAQQIIEIGYGNDLAKSATVNITNGATLTAAAGNVSVGDRPGSGVGLPGHLNMSGSGSQLNVLNTGANLNVGIWAPSSYTQTDGTAAIADQVIVGQRNADGSTFTVSGGTFASGGALTASNGTTAQGNSDNIAVAFKGTANVTIGTSTVSGSTYAISAGLADATNTSLTIADSATLTTSANGVVVVGRNNSLNSSMTVSGNAILNLSANITVGTDTADGSSLNVSGNAQINIPGTASAGNIFLGRVNSKNTTFNMTGGTITLGNHFLMGTAATPGATNIVGNHSGGTITTTNNFVLADNFGASTYNLSGTGTIQANGLVVVGRENAAATMNQTGGTVTGSLGVTVGNAQNATTTLWGSGTYNVSGGTITANQTTGTALNIAPQGNGTFRVIGDDATINVNGNMTVNADATAATVGTLAYQLETGDLLSQISVTGTATFNAGSMLAFDTSLASPTQTSYDLLTAASIVDSGLAFTGPAGWNFQIVSGGLGQILQVTQSGPVGVQGDYNNNGVVDAADYVVWRNGGPLQNEVTGVTPGTVTPEDYDAWRARLGNTSGSGAGTAAVPEPTCAVLCGVFAAGLLATRRRDS